MGVLENAGSSIAWQEARRRKYARLGQLLLAGTSIGILYTEALTDFVYQSDLQQEYLAARALRDGGDILVPVSELSARYFPFVTNNFPHPNPHPPFLTALAVPLTVLPFPIIVLSWLTLNLLLLILIGRWIGLSKLGSLALAAWPPLFWMLLIGQYEVAILALLMAAWRQADSGKDTRAGVLIGVAAAIKLYPLFILVPYVVRRRFRVIAACGAVVMAAQLGNLMVLGHAGVTRYFTEVLPDVSAMYVTVGLNSSPYGAALRLFGGATDVEPLLSVSWLPLAVASIAFFAGLIAAAVLRPTVAPLALLVALPSSWYYYAVLALPQIARLVRMPRIRYWALAAAVATSFVLPLTMNVLRLLAGQYSIIRHNTGALAAVLGAVQPTGYVALLVLVVLLERDCGRNALYHTPSRLRSFSST